jgi:aspartate kinase
MITQKTLHTLTDYRINIYIKTTSSIRISCLIRAEEAETAVRALHAAFELD